MDNWYAYTGESLLVGSGRVIKGIVSEQKKLEQMLMFASNNYSLFSPKIKVSKATYIAALIPQLASLELKNSRTETSFSSLKQVLSLFSDLDIEQIAMNFINGRITSQYSNSDMVAHGFASGVLVSSPSDYSKEILNSLPGIIVFLLSKSNAQRKAFNNYLRRGTKPILSKNDFIEIASTRPILSTFSMDIRAEKLLQLRISQ